jgi:hypothetical protein
MSNKQFLVLVGAMIVLLIGAIGVEHYHTCQEKGGVYCQRGPGKYGIPTFPTAR